MILVIMQNAFKYTEKGQITLEAKPYNPYIIEISIEDTGQGMNNEKI